MCASKKNSSANDKENSSANDNKYSITTGNVRIPIFTDRFRKEVDAVGGVPNLSRKSKISKPTIAYWYNGERTPDAERLIILSNTLHLSTDYLLGLKEHRTYEPDLDAACQYTGLSEQALTGMHDFLRKVPISLDFIDKFIQYCCLHGKILQKIMYAAESNKHVNHESDFKVNTYFFEESLKKIFNPTKEGTINLPDGAIPLPADDAREYFIEQAALCFREFLSDFINQSTGKERQEEEQ